MSDIMNLLAKCQHCEKKYSEGVPRIGESQAERAPRIASQLAYHIAEKHPEYWQSCVLMGQNVASFESLLYFEMPETSWMFQFREGLRRFYRWRYRRYRIDDANIRQMVEKLQLPEEYVERVFALAASMRNVLEEIPPVSQTPNGENQNGTERTPEPTSPLN